MEEWLQCEWLGLDVLIAPVTAAWGVLTITGPKARDIVRAAGTTVPLDDFPHMSFAEGTVAGLPTRVFRVSYTGETSYEINVPARSSALLWDRLMAAGAGQGLTPVGIDAWMVLRTEKGYLHIGADTDGTTNAFDLGWGHVLKKKVDFIGKRSLLRSADQRGDRLQFVGFAVAAGEPPLPIGDHVVATGADGTPVTEGYVTSTAFSPFMQRAVALGMLRGGLARKGETVRIGPALRAGPRRWSIRPSTMPKGSACVVDDPWRVAGHDVAVTRIPTPTIQMLRLRGFDDGVLAALDRSLSIPLPRASNHAFGTGPRAIGLAPGEWMIVGGTIAGDVLVAAAVGAGVAHVADLGEGRVVYAVAGPRARDLIAKGCPIDLHPRVFGAGRCAQSVLAQVFVVIDQPSEDPVFHIYAEASYAQHLDLWFADAVLEFRTPDAD